MKIKLGVTGAAEHLNEPRPNGEDASYPTFDASAADLVATVAGGAFMDNEFCPPNRRGGSHDPSGTSWWGSGALAATPMRRSGYGLENYQYTGYRRSPSLLVVVGETTADAALYMAWTRLYGERTAAWLPASVVNHPESDESQAILGAVQDMVHSHPLAHQLEGWVTSFTLDRTALEGLRLALSRNHWNRDIRKVIGNFRIADHPDDITVEPPPEVFTVTPQTFATSRTVAFRDAVAQTPLLSPVPPIMHEPGAGLTTPLRGNWVADVVVGECKLPQHRYASNAAEAAGGELTSVGELRCGRTGTSWIAVGPNAMPSGLNVEHVLNAFVPRAPDMPAVLDAMLEPEWRWEPSSAGRYYEGFAALAGGLDGLIYLIDDSYSWPMLRAFINDESEAGWAVGSAKVMRFEDMLGVLGLADDSESTAITEDLATARRLTLSRLGDLVDMRILSPGLVLGCTRCSDTDFYLLEEVGRSFACKRCSDVQSMTTPTWKPTSDPDSSTSPGWFYRLDGLVEQAIRHHVEGPALALKRLGVASGPAVYSWSILLRRDVLERTQALEPVTDALAEAPAEKAVEQAMEQAEGQADEQVVPHRIKTVEVEVDFVAVIDGRLVMGEAKTSDHLGESTAKSSQQEIRKNGRAAKALNADQVVFATTRASWNAKTALAIEKFKDTSSRDVVSLEGLEP